MTLEEAVAVASEPALAELARVLPRAIEQQGWRDEFYEGRVRVRDPLADHERALIRALAGLPVATAYHEIGGGVGLMPIVLGLMGHRAVNIDITTSRVAHGQAIVDALPGLGAQVQMIYGRAPAAFERLDTAGACALTTNVGSPLDWDATAELLLAIQRHYAMYVFDVCLQFGIFRTPEAWSERIARLSSLWNREPEFLFELSDPARYYVVRF